jgi:hypothetical protein
MTTTVFGAAMRMRPRATAALGESDVVDLTEPPAACTGSNAWADP